MRESLFWKNRLNGLKWHFKNNQNINKEHIEQKIHEELKKQVAKLQSVSESNGYDRFSHQTKNSKNPLKNYPFVGPSYWLIMHILLGDKLEGTVWPGPVSVTFTLSSTCPITRTTQQQYSSKYIYNLNILPLFVSVTIYLQNGNSKLYYKYFDTPDQSSRQDHLILRN